MNVLQHMFLYDPGYAIQDWTILCLVAVTWFTTCMHLRSLVLEANG